MLNKGTKLVLFSLLLICCIGVGQSQETERVLVYRVQFAASKTFIQPSYFHKKFNLEDSVNYFEKDGYYKYYVGDFDTEGEALAYFHKTGDVGYVISVVVDKVLEVQQDTVQAVSHEDSSLVEVEKPGATSSFVEQEEGDINESGLTGLQVILLICAISFLLVLLIIWFVSKRKRNKSNIDISEFKEEDDVDEEVDKFEVESEVKSGEEFELETEVKSEEEFELESEVRSGVESEVELTKQASVFSVLENDEQDLSGWDQLRMLEMVKEGKVDPPDFSRWLNSDNSTIVAYCLRMIRFLKQEGAYKPVSSLLHHKKDEIRAEAIVTLGMLGNRDVLVLFRDKFDKETYTNRMLILRSMARIPDSSNIDFLKDLLRVSGNLQVEAAHALSAIESVGIEGVESTLKDLGISSEIIARHILINKL